MLLGYYRLVKVLVVFEDLCLGMRKFDTKTGTNNITTIKRG